MWGEEEEARDEHDTDTQSAPTMWDEEEEARDEHDTQSPPIMWDEEEESDDEHDTQFLPTMWDENEEADDEREHDDEDVPSGSSEEGEPKFIADNYSTVDEVITALREAGLESSNLILGIDFTKSNDWSGKHSFGGESLHAIGRTPNPYEQAISIIGRTLSPFDDDNLISCFGFGDVSTRDHFVFSFYEEDRPCCGFEEVLDRYKQIIPYLDFSGPTSFAPLIYAAISVVERSNFQYHVLVIIADGQAATSKSYSILSPQEEATIQALIDASFYPLSIVMVGVGDGPWDEMKHVDDCIPDRVFGNFQFVNFTDIMSTSKDMAKKEAAFAFTALMEIPAQYKATQCLQPPEWHAEMADPWMILPPPIEVLERDYAIAASHAPAATFELTDVGKDASDVQVCPICLMHPKDMAFQCGQLASLPSAALTDVGKNTSDEQLKLVVMPHLLNESKGHGFPMWSSDMQGMRPDAINLPPVPRTDHRVLEALLVKMTRLSEAEDRIGRSIQLGVSSNEGSRGWKENPVQKRFKRQRYMNRTLLYMSGTNCVSDFQ